MNPAKKTARVAGLLYLLLAIFSGFAAYVRSSLFVSTDAAATVNNIKASEVLFRIAIVSDLVGQVVHVLLALVLYQLLYKVSKTYALLMLILALVPVPIAMLNQTNQFAALSLLNNSDPNQIIFYFNLHNFGVLIAQVFWGLWLFPLGYLFYKSGYVPGILSVLLAVAGFGYVIDSFGAVLLPNYNLTISIYTFIGEVTLLLYLLVKGIKD